MLLQQQEWLISGLLKLYSRTQIGSNRPHDLQIEDKSRRISVHQILEQLGVLDDKNRISLEPVVIPSSEQQRGGVSGDAYEGMPYSSDVDAYDDRSGAFDSMQSESFSHSPTTAASDDLPMLMSGDLCSTSFQFPSLVEEESESTMWIQDSDTDFSYFQPWCRDALVSGYEQPFGNVIAAKMQNWFQSPVPATVHGDLGSVFVKDTTKATQNSPPMPFRLVPDLRRSGPHVFFPKVAFASIQGDKRT